MSDSLEVKQLERKLLTALVARELIKLTQNVSMNTIESFKGKKFEVPDMDAWANRIISVVKEHSV